MNVFRKQLLILSLATAAPVLWAQVPAAAPMAPVSSPAAPVSAPVAAPVSAAMPAPTAAPVATDAAALQPAALGTPPAPGQVQPLGNLMGVGVDYRIGPNDLLDVDVFGVPDLKRSVRVNSSGMVSLPLIGPVTLVGMTAQQAEADIAARYSEKYLQNPQVSVFIREFTTQRITIEGAVARPGIYPVTGQITLLRALALAGGGAQYADLTQIMLFRTLPGQPQQTLTFDLEKIRSGEEPDPPIRADDVLVVKRNPARAALRDSLFRDIIDSINPFSALRPN